MMGRRDVEPEADANGRMRDNIVLEGDVCGLKRTVA